MYLISVPCFSVKVKRFKLFTLFKYKRNPKIVRETPNPMESKLQFDKAKTAELCVIRNSF
jgi:hypothetical protein